MLKENKWKIIISNLIILLPIFFGLIFWNQLPSRMATHWGINGNVDGWSNKAFAVFFVPLIILVCHWICIIAINHDAKNKGQSPKVVNILFFIMPVVSLLSSFMIYSESFGMEMQIYSFMPVFLGLIFIIIGNYLPKCKQNHTIGIKVPWTYNSEENWNKTHRMGGIMYVAGGTIMLGSAFMPGEMTAYTTLIMIIIMAVAPILYSYALYIKAKKDNRDLDNTSLKDADKSHRNNIIFYGIAAVIIIAILVLLNVDGYNIRYDDTSFTIETNMWSDLTVDYAAIDTIEYREECDEGVRTFGFGNFKMLMGTFKNNEFGQYTRYSHSYCHSCVILTVNGEILAIGKETPELTKSVYDQLLNRINV